MINFKSILLSAITAFLFSYQGNGQDSSKINNEFIGNWATILPNGHPAWFSFNINGGVMNGEIWTVGLGNAISDLRFKADTLYYKRKLKTGAPNYPGGPPTGEKVEVSNKAVITGDVIKMIMYVPLQDGTFDTQEFKGKRLPPLPLKPDLDKVKFGAPIALFNGKDLSGWRLTNPNQINGWRAENGVLVNETPKLNFDPFSKYGNLRTDGEFKDFNLQLEFNVPKGGNSGIYLCGRYETQVVDRDSRMQGLQGVGALFARIAPSENAGKVGGEWQKYDITLVDQHVTIVLNGKKVVDNAPILGATKGALDADDTKPGPIYFQGDHTAVNYRNIMLRPRINPNYIQKDSSDSEFSKFDINGDNNLIATEIPLFEQDVFDQADANVDWQLSMKEFKSYNAYKKRIQSERALIPKNARAFRDIPYIQDGHNRHTLDLYLPDSTKFKKPYPLVIWVHGGGWQKGTKQLFGKQAFLLKHGFAMASINYRLTRESQFPEQVYDCKAAIRYLRKYADQYKIDANRFGLWGSSAGGHLVSLIGTTGGLQELEGSLGVTDASSEVQAVCDWFGPSDLNQMNASSTDKSKGEKQNIKPIVKFLGGPFTEKQEAARKASAINYISNNDPPFLIMHGNKDPLVPIEQSELFYQALQKKGVDSEYIIVKDAGHTFFTGEKEHAKVVNFFNEKLKK
ncbi:family 16 glycoside hydrolase [Zobellia laminariae]|uniref:family 16 glycoside hydrolase n=1 Tax=Zobellia laminariae TaxID=248906 RepID=UPI0040578A94